MTSGSRTRWCGCTSCSATPTRSGSLIDPKRAVEITDPTGLQQSFDDVDWDDIAPLLTKALTRETDDPATAVLGADAAGIARAADYLSRHYTLVTTNVPIPRQRQASRTSSGDLCERHYRDGSDDLATAFVRALRCSRRRRLRRYGHAPELAVPSVAIESFASELLRERTFAASLHGLATGAFESISGEVVQPSLLSCSSRRASRRSHDACSST